jgi:hypothetical protein
MHLKWTLQGPLSVALFIVLVGRGTVYAAPFFSPCDNPLNTAHKNIVLGGEPAQSPVIIYPEEVVQFSVSAIKGQFDWFLDGELAATTPEAMWCVTFQQAGFHTLSASSGEQEAVFPLALEVVSYNNIKLKHVLPNPVGSDTNAEEIILSNDNPFPVTLRNWELRSQTSKTIIPINAVIAAQEDATIKTSNKLLNSGGRYDLYNESNQLVDTVAYDDAEEGSVLSRIGLLWQGSLSAAKSQTVESEAIPEKVFVTGTVVKPSGRTIDIKTVQGEQIRIVIHASFTGTKPRLHKGDTIQISGEWKRSRRGPYISVREGDIVALLAEAPKKRKTSARRKAATVSKKIGSSLIPKAQAAGTVTELPDQLYSADMFSDTPDLWRTDPYIKWLFSVVITFGVWLAISPVSRKFENE